MNCKPGDLARVISTEVTRRYRLVDRFIRVTEVTYVGADGAFWDYEGPRFQCPCGCGKSLPGINDEVLRPIRPAGDDEATQETRERPKDALLTEFAANLRGLKRDLESA